MIIYFKNSISSFFVCLLNVHQKERRFFFVVCSFCAIIVFSTYGFVGKRFVPARPQLLLCVDSMAGTVYNNNLLARTEAMDNGPRVRGLPARAKTLDKY